MCSRQGSTRAEMREDGIIITRRSSRRKEDLARQMKRKDRMPVARGEFAGVEKESGGGGVVRQRNEAEEQSHPGARRPWARRYPVVVLAACTLC